MLRAVIFDLDGTITLTEELHHRAFAAVFADYGINFSLSEQVSTFAGSGSEVIFRSIFSAHGLFFDDERIDECISRKRKLYTKIVQEVGIPVVKGVRDFIDKINGMGLKKIIATGNGSRDAIRLVLNKVGLDSEFKEVVSVSEVLRSKPFPDVFLEAARRIECEPAECLVLEDSVNGVTAAVTAGIRCVAFSTTTGSVALKAAGAEHVIPDYTYITDKILYGQS